MYRDEGGEEGEHGNVLIDVSPLLSTCFSKVRSQKKKNDIIWEFFPNVGPPPTPPFWEPLIQKKNLVFILHFRT